MNIATKNQTPIDPRDIFAGARAVLFLAAIFALLAFVVIVVLRRTTPCHADTVQRLASADNAFVAQKVAVTCNGKHASEGGVEIGVSERNNSEGKSKQLANIFAVAGVGANDVQIAWTGARTLNITVPRKHAAITAQQQAFKDVTIHYTDAAQ